MRPRGLLLLSLIALAGCSTTPKWASLTAPSQPQADAPLSKTAQADLYLGIVNGLIKQGRYEAAIAFLDQYKESQAQSPRYQLLRGEALLGAKQYDDADLAFNAAVKSDQAAQAWCGLGRVEAARGRWDAATKDFAQASHLDPANASYLNNLGYAKLQQGATGAPLDAAETDLKRAYELDPNSNTIRNNLILAANLSNDHSQLSMLLAMIGDMQQRGQVMDFAKNWSAGHDDGAAPSVGGIQ
jgi:tetratricopeptide (TPR) repeat protein